MFKQSISKSTSEQCLSDNLATTADQNVSYPHAEVINFISVILSVKLLLRMQCSGPS